MNTIPRRILVFSQRKFRQIFKKAISKNDQEFLKNTNFVIISNNCWGGAIYQWLERPYNTPFIGLGIKGPCYLKILSNLDYYLNTPIIFSTESKYPDRKIAYPLGIIDDVEIHFTHYKNENEAKEKWERRSQRMLLETNRDNYFFKICDSWGMNTDLMEKFHQLPYKNKISFTASKSENINCSSHIEVFEKDKIVKTTVPNGVKLFKLTFIYTDIMYWIKHKKITLSA